MSWTFPDWWQFALLALAAFRTWKLIGDDTILDRPRAWVVKRGGEYVEILLECPWCSGFYWSVGWWLGWQFWPHATVVVAVPLAISAVVGLLGHLIAD